MAYGHLKIATCHFVQRQADIGLAGLMKRKHNLCGKAYLDCGVGKTLVSILALASLPFDGDKRFAGPYG